MLKSVTLINSDLRQNNIRLQPWRYLYEVTTQLQRLGHPVTLISDTKTGITNLTGIRVNLLETSSNSKWSANQTLARIIKEINSDVILWHVGLTSFLHQNFNINLAKPTLGIFTSPIYARKDLMRLGWFKLAAGYPLCGMNFIGSLLPIPLLRSWMRNSGLNVLVVQTETTSVELRENRLWDRPIHIIPPGVDEIWLRDRFQPSEEIRQKFGFLMDDPVVVYFGPPDRLRGLPTLLKAFEIAQRSEKKLKLLVLRRSGKRPFNLKQALNPDPSKHPHLPGMYFMDGFLSPYELASFVAACDVAALPFELVPSDAPLSLLEARALGKTLVTTNVACLPELAGEGAHLVPPGDPVELSKALLKAVGETRHQTEHFHCVRDTQIVNSWRQIGATWSNLIQSL